ncbi:MAG: bifunctional adenosylcobinamide kinase/adenosylcobinamide-phosphate guanylyltransferase [Ruminococcus sp.]|nr:bifunctional adenosylcobinamide kinase/adenosylcobinamide-phosphate guanylyltransferase [Ruminococcus sp.]
MLTLITGGSKCGKSRLAEKILPSAEGGKYYIAAMQPLGSEAYEAIRRHREMRSGKGFITVEKYTDIHELSLPRGSSALIECMCNLTANEMFSAGEKDPVEKILFGVGSLCEVCSDLVIVTNQVGGDGIGYPAETELYIKYLGQLNAAVAKRADCVIEAVYGIPVCLKGKERLL